MRGWFGDLPLTWVLAQLVGIEGFARRAELRVLTLRFPDGESGLSVDGKVENFVAVGSYTSTSKGQAMVGDSNFAYTLYGGTWLTR